MNNMYDKIKNFGEDLHNNLVEDIGTGVAGGAFNTAASIEDVINFFAKLSNSDFESKWANDLAKYHEKRYPRKSLVKTLSQFAVPTGIASKGAKYLGAIPKGISKVAEIPDLGWLGKAGSGAMTGALTGALGGNPDEKSKDATMGAIGGSLLSVLPKDPKDWFIKSMQSWEQANGKFKAIPSFLGKLGNTAQGKMNKKIASMKFDPEDINNSLDIMKKHFMKNNANISEDLVETQFQKFKDTLKAHDYKLDKVKNDILPASEGKDGWVDKKFFKDFQNFLKNKVSSNLPSSSRRYYHSINDMPEIMTGRDAFSATFPQLFNKDIFPQFFNSSSNDNNETPSTNTSKYKLTSEDEEILKMAKNADKKNKTTNTLTSEDEEILKMAKNADKKKQNHQ